MVGVAVTAPAVLDVHDLRVSYAGAVKALRGVSLIVPEGAVVAVLGNNGAGSVPESARSSVDLPAPLLPSTATTAPSGTVSETPRSAFTAPA